MEDEYPPNESPEQTAQNPERNMHQIIFGIEHALEWRGPFDVFDKLSEARYFLNQMKYTDDFNEFRWLTSACLSACRAAVDWLALYVRQAHVPEDAEDYYRPPQEVDAQLLQFFGIIGSVKSKEVRTTPLHPLLVEMHNLRKRSAHHGPLQINKLAASEGEAFTCPGDVFVFVKPVVPRVDSDSEWELTYGWIPGRRVVSFMSQVIELLDDLNQAANAPREE